MSALSSFFTAWLIGDWTYPSLTFVFTSALKCALVFGLAQLLSMLLRKHSSLLRSWLWRVCLVAMLSVLGWGFAPSMMEQLRPRLEVPRTMRMSVLSQTIKEWNIIDEHSAPRQSPDSRAFLPMPSTAAPKPMEVAALEVRVPLMIRVEALASRIWWAGMLLLMAIRIMQAACGLWWLHRKSNLASTLIQAVAKRAAETLRVRAMPICRLVEELSSPVITGLLKPTIWLPTQAEGWPESKLRAVFLHELAHHVRRDGAWQWLGWLTASAWWWHPLSWIALRRLAKEAELSADELALAHDLAAPDYASALVEIAAEEGLPMRSIGVAMLGRSPIEQRVRAVLEGSSRRGKFGRVAKLTLACGAIISVIATGVGVMAQGQLLGPRPKLPADKQALAEATRKVLNEHLDSLHAVHLKLEERWTVTDKKTGKSTTCPTPSKAEAWLADSNGRYRVNWRPRASRWTNGAAPWYISEETYVCDGKHSWDIDERDSNREVKLREKDKAWIMTGDSAGAAAFALQQMLDPFSAYLDVQFNVTTQMLDGNTVTHLSKSTLTGDAVAFRESWDIAPDSGMIVHYIAERPATEAQPFLEWRLLKVGKAPDGAVYPAGFSSLNRDTEDITHTTTEVTMLEVIQDISPELLLPPSSKTATDTRFTAPQGTAVQREHLELHFVDASNGKAVPEVKVDYDLNGSDNRLQITSDSAGIARIPLLKDEVKSLRLWGMKKGYVMQRVHWSRYRDPLQLPETYEVKLEHASPIKGVVVDESGKPVVDATIHIWHSGRVRSWSVFADIPDNTDREAKTNAKGEWSMGGFPANLTNLSMKVTHPDYELRGNMDYRHLTGLGYESLRDGTSRAVLTPGKMYEIKGSVTTTEGKPVEKCRITLAEDRFGSDPPTLETAEDGSFVLKTRKEMNSWLTAEAAGWQPKMMKFDMKQMPTEPVRFVLEKSKGLRARVVDENGNPIPKAWVVANRWNGHRSLWWETHADEEGRFLWDGAPHDEVMLDLLPDGQHELRDLRVTASDQELTLVVKPATRFIGTVVDARRNEPVKKFTITGGDTRRNATDIYWSDISKQIFLDGSFQWDTWWMREDHRLKIEADGYEPFITEAVTPKQQVVSLAIRLKAK